MIALEAIRSPKVLVVDDDQDDCAALSMWLRRGGCTVSPTDSGATALETLDGREYDVVVTDLAMPEMDGLELCARLSKQQPNLPVIVITGKGDVDAVTSAMHAGAYDFITKPIDPALISIRVARAVQYRRFQNELVKLRDLLEGGRKAPDLIGQSASMRRVRELIGRVADSDVSVLIQGETGTGKELVARAIHAESRRSAGPFVAVNCSAIPSTLIESELFGHARGAFTDAKKSRIGLMSGAEGGTLFLDEVGDLPLEMQPKLLRALQERTLRPVGSNSEVPFDARIIAATNRDLEFEVAEHRFREDLFYRLHVITVEVPPLRERTGDVLRLAQHFLTQSALNDGKPALSLAPSAAHRLMAYDWPGNVRELENAIERAVALARFDQVTIEDLPEKIRGYSSDHFAIAANDVTEVVTLYELERRYIGRVIGLLGGNRSRAAEILGIDRRTLYRRLQKYDSRLPPKPEN